MAGMGEGRYIPESEFAEDLAASLEAIAAMIARSGLSIAAIARETGLHWQSVANAANGVPVRFDSARRLQYFLRVNNNEPDTKIV